MDRKSLLGPIATALCVLGVAFLGAMMLTGRWHLRRGFRVVLGCFVLLALKQRSGSGQKAGADDCGGVVFV